MSPRPKPPGKRTNAHSPAQTMPWAYALLLRLHFYLGLMVGPFILVAAFTGGLYVISPQIENLIYEEQLTAVATGETLSLAAQIQAARVYAGDAAVLVAVRPAPAAGATTRIMFADSGLHEFQHRAIFIDPVSAEILGDAAVYGTSGALPFRAWVDLLHRSLHLGDFGRHYSELAASWLWLVALGGVVIWVVRRQRRPTDRPGHSGTNGPSPTGGGSEASRQRGRLGRWHSTTGLILLMVLLFFSVTGLTWSQWAGTNISVLRSNLGWGTPSVNTALADIPAQLGDAHSHHEHAVHEGASPEADLQRAPALFDAVLSSARSAGINAGMVEIKPPAGPGRAWTVTEIDRRWPTQVDAAAVDPSTLRVVDQTDFSEFPLAAKLTRWGIDAHMGVLFGWPNQLVLFMFALGLCFMVVLGYVMWWRRRPTRLKSARSPGIVEAFMHLAIPVRIAAVVVAALLGWFLPVMGVSLVLFLILDVMLRRVRR